MANFVQSSGLQKVANSTTPTFTFNMPGNFTAGNSVLLGCASFLAGTDSITGITVAGTAMVKDATRQNSTSLSYWSNVWRCQSVAGGSSTVVVTFSATGGYFAGSCEEFATLAASPLDQTASGQNDNAAGNLVLTTGAKSQSTEVVYGVAISSQVFAGSVTIAGPNFGFTQTALQNTAGDLGVAVGYKEVAAAGTEAATWTTNSQDLCGILVTYKVSAGAASSYPIQCDMYF